MPPASTSREATAIGIKVRILRQPFSSLAERETDVAPCILHVHILIYPYLDINELAEGGIREACIGAQRRFCFSARDTKRFAIDSNKKTILPAGHCRIENDAERLIVPACNHVALCRRMT